MNAGERASLYKLPGTKLARPDFPWDHRRTTDTTGCLFNLTTIRTSCQAQSRATDRQDRRPQAHAHPGSAPRRSRASLDSRVTRPGTSGRALSTRDEGDLRSAVLEKAV